MRRSVRIDRTARTGARRVKVLYAGRGTFGANIRRGVEAGARATAFDVVRAIAFDTPLRDTKTLPAAALADSPNLLVVAGRFEDDIAITRERRLLETVGTVASRVSRLERTRSTRSSACLPKP